jgi:hypothetical protein
MEEKIFLNKEEMPEEVMLSAGLGESYDLWCMLRDALKKEYPEIKEEWKYYGKKSGWSLKILLKKRNLFFFLPYKKGFKLGFVFGDKAAGEIGKSNLPKQIVDELNSAKKYVEGRSLIVDIKSRTDIPVILTLVMIKIRN